MNIKFQGILYTEALELRQIKRKLRSLPSWKRTNWVIGLLLLAIIATILFMLTSPSATAWSFLPELLMLVVVLCLFPLIRMVVPVIAAKRSAKAQVVFRESVTGELNETLLQIDRPSSSSSFQWSRFTRAEFELDVILLWIDEMAYIPLSRRLFASENDWSTAVEFVKRTVPIASPK